MKEMKKIMMAGLVIVGSAGLFACDRTNENNTTESEADNSVVVDRDSVATEYEVTETVVDYDTTTRTKTVDTEEETDKDRNDDRDRDRDNDRNN
ncbi:hypothetical protein WG947_07940 [Pontibacter sp. H259]|uniref:hypothetical protein n=1 Tax=Pontibacter sp. H259 TaxID=3133421 RepID=UPI0030BE80DB